MLQQKKKLQQSQLTECESGVYKFACTGALVLVALTLLGTEIEKSDTAAAQINQIPVPERNSCLGNRHTVDPYTASGEHIIYGPAPFICSFQNGVDRADAFAEQTDVCRTGTTDQTLPVIYGNIFLPDSQVSPDFGLGSAAEQRAKIAQKNDDRQKRDRIPGNTENVIREHCRPPPFWQN